MFRSHPCCRPCCLLNAVCSAKKQGFAPLLFCLAINSFGCPRQQIKNALPVFALCAASGVSPAGTKGERKVPLFASALSLSARTRPSRPPERKRLAPFAPCRIRSSPPHILIFSITWIFFPLKEFSFLETIRFLCNYVSVVVFYLNFFRRHAMKSLFCFFLGLAFLPVSASAI